MFMAARKNIPARNSPEIILTPTTSVATTPWATSAIVGTSGDDILFSTLGDDSIDGGDGFDKLSYINATAGVTVSLATNAAQNTGGAGIDTISNVEGLIGSNFDDHLTGSFRADWFEGGEGNDWIDGGRDMNTASYASASSGVTVDLTQTGPQNTGGAGTDTLININNLVGSAFDDHLVAKRETSYRVSSLFEAGAGNDLLQGSDGYDQFYGGDGNDSLIGMGDIDLLDGGAGDDLLDGGNGDDMLHGGAGDDSLDGGAGFDTADYRDATGALSIDLRLSGAQDTLAAGIDTLTGIEQIFGGIHADILHGADANETFYGGNGADTLYGGNGNDIISGIQIYASATGYVDDASNDALYGGDGNDQLAGGLGDDILDGGTGFDTISYVSATSAITIDLGISGPQDTGGAGVDTLISIEAVIGSQRSDIIYGGDGDDQLDGRSGSDRLYGGSGNDTLLSGFDFDDNDRLYGGDGNDILRSQYNNGVLFGDAGEDTLYGIYRSRLNGGEGDDIIYGGDYLGYGYGNILNGDAGDDYLWAGGGRRFLYDPAAELNILNGGIGDDILYGGLYSSVLNGGADNDILDGGNRPDTLNGGAGDDILDGGEHTDTVTYADATAAVTVSLAITTAQDTGGAGVDTLLNVERLVGSTYNDVLAGGSGDDRLFGGNGADTLSGGAGYDVLDGGAHTDTASYADATAAVKVDLAILTTQDTGGAGKDRLISIENLLGSAFDDRLYGDAGNNRLTGGDGADWLNGRDGNDILSGGAQDDRLTGGLGNDRLTGGAGEDSFFFNATLGADNVDTIVDFTVGEDIILLEDGIFQGLPKGVLTASAFVTGTAALDADDRIIYDSATGALLFDADGTGATAAIQFATLTSLPALTNGDLLVA
jgi:Ca2+-binding RTX toxin-like protein